MAGMDARCTATCLWGKRLWGKCLVGWGLLVVWSLAWCGTPAVAQTPPGGKPPGGKPQPGAQATAPAGPAAADIVAVVNRQPITRDQLAEECLRRFGGEVLESEVNKYLILQECQKNGIKVTAGEVEAEIARMAGKFNLSVDRWLEMLQTERELSPAQYRRDIIWPMLALRKLADGRVEVTGEALRQAYEAEYGASVQVRIIVTRSRSKAEQLRQQAAAKPEDFGRLAKDHSEDENSAATRGLIPPIRRHVGAAEIEEAAFALRAGEVSAVVASANQFFVMKCERHLPARELLPEQRAQAEAQLQETLADRQLRSAASEVFRRLQAQSQVVNVFNDPQLRHQLPGVAATVNGQKITLKALGDQCLLRHGRDVLEGEINRRLLEQALQRRSQQVTPEELQLEIRRAAESYGLVAADGQVDVEGWLQKVTEEGKISVDTYVRDAVWPTVALKRLVSGSIEVTDEDLQKGFQANYGERVEALAIVLSSQRTAHEVFDLARKNPSEKFFGELAHQYSVEPVSRANFGQVPPIRQFGGQPLIEDEAFRLRPGEISSVLAVGDKFVILRCLGRTKPVVDDLETVRDELQADIREKKLRVAMAREFDQLKEKSQIDNFLAKTTQAGEPAAAAPNSAPVQAAGFQLPPAKR